MISTLAREIPRTPVTPSARVVALYLPQFHPTRENDEWWGPGFTEWTNVAKARALYPGHYQPRVPRDLGFYDLRLPETREAQAELAAAHGIEAFCYWHYWFAGRRILERPFEEVLSSGRPRLPFCLAWANDTWSGVWHGAKNRILIEQTYPGVSDYTAHFEYLRRAFSDERYLLVDGKPLFAVLYPRKLPDARLATDTWRELAHRAGFPGLHLVAFADHGELEYDAGALGFDAVCYSNQIQIHSFVHHDAVRAHVLKKRPAYLRSAVELARDYAIVAKYRVRRRYHALRGWPKHVYDYNDAMRYFPSHNDYGVPSYPSLIPDWDHSPRCGGTGVILHGSTPELFGRHVAEALDSVRDVPRQQRLVFVKSWNEWAEGNYLEPDLRHGAGYLKALAEELHRQPLRVGA
jgi:lipopolysaccharide biosynthesis protein